LKKGIFNRMIKMISYQENTDLEGFILKENEFDKIKKAEQLKKNPPPGGGDNGRETGGAKKFSRLLRRNKKQENITVQTGEESTGKNHVQASLDKNREIICELYNIPKNKDIVLREFTLTTDPPVAAFMVYVDGMANSAILISLLQDLIVFPRLSGTAAKRSVSSLVREMLPSHQTKTTDLFKDITSEINYGNTAFFFEGVPTAVVAETRDWEHRSVEKPRSEQTIAGPQEGFIENLRANTSLIRKIVRTEKLNTEFISIGERIKSSIAVMYLRDLANPSLVAEVKRRLSGIKIDFLNDTGMLEQFIEDNPYNFNSQTLITERPDRVAAALSSGRVAILVSGSPNVMIVPVTMYEQLHTGEESYLRWHYGTFIRTIRNFSFYLALLLPGIYLAVVLFHQEMIPTELLLAIAGNREKVPFPSYMEMLLLEFSFELVREAGLRIPGIIGPTIGIVGALILGQAAVQANIVSPILVIMVAVTGLASFSIPSYALAFTVRIYRFFYIFLGAMLGFYGITMGLFIQILLTANLKSFGVPFLVPGGPRTYTGPDIVYRLPFFLHHRRPDYLNAQDDIRMPEEPRKWLKKGGSRKK